MMRMIASALEVAFVVAAVGVVVGVAPCAAAQPTTPTCPEIPRFAPMDHTASRTNALHLLGSVTQLLSPLGRPVMASNLATTVAINNQATASLRAQALIDAQITNENAYTVADGLGATMAAIYRAKAAYVSPDDGAHIHCGQIGPAVTALMTAANATSREDSGAGKMGYADRTSTLFPLPPGGAYDVIGKAYDLEAGTKGSDPFGNSRPFQTASLGAPSGPHIVTYDGTDFFGIATQSGIDLAGPTPADEAAGRTGSNLTKSPSFPSGHTTFGYTEALALAMMVPERYSALAYRGSEYGNSRIVIGAHYAIDVIGGRTLATYDLAQDLAGTKGYAQVSGHGFRTALAAAAGELRASLQANGCPSIAACAARDPIVRAENASVVDAGTVQPATTRKAYAFRLHYGLATMASDRRAPDPVPAEAATLIATRFPYLTADQRREVLRSTEGPAGHFLDVSPIDGAPLASGVPVSEAGLYSRLDLYAAAGGYATLAGPVVVDQDPASVTDPDLRPFLDLARTDTWSNDIDGDGGLTKRGSGTLILSGQDTYRGATVVEGGTLEIAGSLASAVRVESNGTLAGGGKLGGALVLADGAAIALRADPTAPRFLEIAGQAKLDGGRLIVSVREPVAPGTRVTVLTAQGGVSGTFASVATDAKSVKPKLTYTNDSVVLTFLGTGAAAPPD